MKRISGIKLNFIANLLGKTCVGLISLLFVPIYIRMLGMESYGLIGVYATLTGLIQFLDLGLTTTLNREMARLSGLECTEQEARDLVRTLEIAYWLIGVVAGVAIVCLAPVIAHRWVHAQGLPASTVQQAIMLMGAVFALQWPDSFYAGGLMGLQRQVLLNGIRIVAAVCLALGSVLVLKFVSHTILAYFVWQTIVFGAQTLALVAFLWRSLPHAVQRPMFRKELWVKNARFTAGVTGISAISIVLMQLDKVLLSNQLPLKLFGYYALANALAANLLYPVLPLFSAVFPRMAQLATQGKQEELAALYHKSCQMLSLIIIPIWAVVAIFSRQLLLLYLHDAQVVDQVHLLLSLLVTGSALNALMMLPFGLQMAYGYTSLSFYKNIVAVIVFVPALRWMIAHYQAAGAACMWIAINGSYVIFEIPLMHRRLLSGQMCRWYLVDIGLPLVTTFCIVWVARLAIRDTLPLSTTTFGIALTCIAAFGLTSIVLRMARRKLDAGRYRFADL